MGETQKIVKVDSFAFWTNGLASLWGKRKKLPKSIPLHFGQTVSLVYGETQKIDKIDSFAFCTNGLSSLWGKRSNSKFAKTIAFWKLRDEENLKNFPGASPAGPPLTHCMPRAAGCSRPQTPEVWGGKSGARLRFDENTSIVSF